MCHLKPYQRNKLNELNSLLAGDDSSRYLAFVSKILKQHKLDCSLEPYEVLHETYCRVKNMILSNRQINNLERFLFGVIRNIVWEKLRDVVKRKENICDPSSSTFQELTSAHIESEDSDVLDSYKRETLDQVIRKLSIEQPALVQLIKWRIIENKSYSEIRIALRSEMGEDVCESTLRKRISRAKETLKKLYDFELEIVNKNEQSFRSEFSFRRYCAIALFALVLPLIGPTAKNIATIRLCVLVIKSLESDV